MRSGATMVTKGSIPVPGTTKSSSYSNVRLLRGFFVRCCIRSVHRLFDKARRYNLLPVQPKSIDRCNYYLKPPEYLSGNMKSKIFLPFMSMPPRTLWSNMPIGAEGFSKNVGSNSIALLRAILSRKGFSEQPCCLLWI